MLGLHSAVAGLPVYANTICMQMYLKWTKMITGQHGDLAGSAAASQQEGPVFSPCLQEFPPAGRA